MNFLAAAATSQPTAMERLRQIPVEFWVRVGIGIAVIIGVVIALRKLAKVNKVVLAMVLLVGASIIGFTWIYERNEPAWATPVVQWLAEFFPSKGKH